MILSFIIHQKKKKKKNLNSTVVGVVEGERLGRRDAVGLVVGPKDAVGSGVWPTKEGAADGERVGVVVFERNGGGRRPWEGSGVGTAEGRGDTVGRAVGKRNLSQEAPKPSFTSDKVSSARLPAEVHGTMTVYDDGSWAKAPTVLTTTC
jgi:hypothetical protein